LIDLAAEVDVHEAVGISTTLGAYPACCAAARLTSTSSLSRWRNPTLLPTSETTIASCNEMRSIIGSLCLWLLVLELQAQHSYQEFQTMYDGTGTQCIFILD